MWPDQRVVKVVQDEFIPVRVHVREQDEYKRLSEKYGAEWTPTVVMLDPTGVERHRVEGFLPLPEFLPQLEFGRGRIDFSLGRYDDAERRFRHITAEHPDADIAPEALYWAGVSKYKASNDKAALAQTAVEFAERYTTSSWAKKSSVWLEG